MKRVTSLPLLVILLLFSPLIALHGCGSTKVQKVTCQHGGVLQQGHCECTAGYGGQFCEKELRDAYMGRWKAVEVCNQAEAFGYEITITPSGNGANKFLLGNFGDFSNPLSLTAVVTDGTHFQILAKESGDMYIEPIGIGKLVDANTITFKYTLQAGRNPAEICQLKLTRL